LPLFGKRQQISAETLEAILCGKVKPLLLSASQQQNPEREMLKKKLRENASNPPKWAGICQLDLKWKLFEENQFGLLLWGIRS